jgi:hypothetical protein
MSSSAIIQIAGMTVWITNNYYDSWYFRKSERFHDETVSQTEGSEEVFYFSASAKKIKQRMELAGYTRKKLEKEFDEQVMWVARDLQETDMSERLEPGEFRDFYMARQADRARYHRAVVGSKLQDWIDRLEIIWKKGWEDRSSLDRIPVVTGDDLLDYMITANDITSNSIGPGRYGFPCETVDAYAVALLEFMPEDQKFTLDVTDLIAGGWTDEFNDLIEYKSKNTAFYEVFTQALDDIHLLNQLHPENQTLARLLYASVITAMESYLSDTLKKQVLDKESIRIRFIKFHAFFKSKIAISEIYDELNGLKEKIVQVIDEMSFHNLSQVIPMYREVLAIDFPIEDVPYLTQALINRHDIVHRNGKQKNGTHTPTSIYDVSQLIDVVNKTVASVDLQIKDRMLEDDDE